MSKRHHKRDLFQSTFLSEHADEIVKYGWEKDAHRKETSALFTHLMKILCVTNTKKVCEEYLSCTENTQHSVDKCVDEIVETGSNIALIRKLNEWNSSSRSILGLIDAENYVLITAVEKHLESL